MFNLQNYYPIILKSKPHSSKKNLEKLKKNKKLKYLTITHI